jgi:alkylation response protein AidB-like acyl-CoA dehydrogenase
VSPFALTDDERRLQLDVRSFLDDELVPGTYEVGLGMPGASDPAFSRALGRRGWLGMALDPAYGGGGRSAVERLIVVEELLARGAPVAYHWVGDRQTGPTIQRFGTEEQKQAYLPGICRGEVSFAIGMSEPDSGSDLASLRSRAERDGDGWRINGTKIWTSGAAEATHFLGLFRTSPERYEGLTQFIVDRHAEGVSVSPITFIDGSRHFCEVSFQDVRVADTERLGDVGSGWQQNTAELALERGGVDRWMSMVPVIERWAASLDPSDGCAVADLGVITARLRVLRALSLTIARAVDNGVSPVIEAAMLKEIGTRVEQQCVELVARHRLVPVLPSSLDEQETLLAQALQVAPSWTIRGGTSEILRSVIAKGLRQAGTWTSGHSVDDELAVAVDELMTDRQVLDGLCDDDGTALWTELQQLGLTRVGVAENRGGSGGSLDDVLTVLRVAARHGAPLPLAEAFLGSTLLGAAGLREPDDGLTTTASSAIRAPVGNPVAVPAVPWGAGASRAVVLGQLPSGDHEVLVLDLSRCATQAGRNLAGEPTADLSARTDAVERAILDDPPEDWWWLGALCRTAQIAGALESSLAITTRYVSERSQFGKPIGSFQAVQRHVVDLAEAHQMASMALRCAASAWGQISEHRTFEVCAAKLAANEAARRGARAAHQAHGAIGMTREYPLHRLTTRLSHWRFDFGTEKQLSKALGGAISSGPSFPHSISDHENRMRVPCPLTFR